MATIAKSGVEPPEAAHSSGHIPWNAQRKRDVYLTRRAFSATQSAPIRFLRRLELTAKFAEKSDADPEPVEPDKWSLQISRVWNPSGSVSYHVSGATELPLETELCHSKHPVPLGTV